MRSPRRALVLWAAISAMCTAFAACAGPVVAPTPAPSASTILTSSSLGPSLTSEPTAASPSLAPSTAGLPPGPPLPAHVFAPYTELYAGDPVLTTAGASGARHMTLAFLETTGTDSCELGWNGAAGFDDAGSQQLIEDVVGLRAMGGDVIPSFGGYSADNTGREIGDSCADPEAIADGYASIVAMLGATRLDMDIEDRSLERADDIDRRNKGLRILQDRLAAQGRTVQVQYTLPTSPDGLDAGGLAVLRNAVENGTQVDLVNIMVFDYYDGTTTDMAAAAKSAATALHTQLAGLYPDRSKAELWAMVGITLMPGIDDYPQKTELTSLKHAEQVLAFARANGIGALSMWALQRDHGTCPGEAGHDDCSGIKQADWAFTKLLGAFTGP
jgi:Glycosyl hydrolases family 18